MELYSNERVIRIGLTEQTQTPPARKSYLCIKSFMCIVFKYVFYRYYYDFEALHSTVQYRII